MDWQAVDYDALKSRAKENYNYAKLAARLADYGWACIRLSDDWAGSDLIAVHHTGTVLKIQLKTRLGFYKAYLTYPDLLIAFRDEDTWYLYNHDELLQIWLPEIEASGDWEKNGYYTWPGLSVENRRRLKDCVIPHPPTP